MICSSGITYDPQVGGRRLTFGFHGIWQGTAVLYDHQTGSFWMHLTGECFAGELKGTWLERIGTGRHTTWAHWLHAHPTTDVILPDPRYESRSADKGYFPEQAARRGADYFPTSFPQTIQTRDARLQLSELLYGVVVKKAARAYPFKHLEQTPVVEEELEGVPISVWYDAVSKSGAAYNRRVGGKTLRFRPGGAGEMQDVQTKSIWSMDGVCVRGPLKASRLTPVFGSQAEWYGWYANYPDTTVWAP